MLRETLANYLKEHLRKLSLEEFAQLFIDPIKAVEDFYNLCHGAKVGNTISLLFNPHRLDTISQASVTRISAPASIYQSLFDEGTDKYIEKIDGLARLMLYHLERGYTKPFYHAIERGFNGISYINEFPPYVARSIIQSYCKKKDYISVLDPCAGWGGRMIGTASLPNTRYTACEPATRTYEGLLKLGEWLRSLQPEFEYDVRCLPYEDFESDEKFDIALTSPPYYNTELYSDEETNSLNRYATFDSWVDGFYKPLILNTIDRLTDDGVFVLNVGDRKYPLSERLQTICDAAGLSVVRITDYLSGNGEGKEKFYCVSKTRVLKTARKLF